MSYYGFGWRPYVPVAQKRANAVRYVNKKLGKKANPINIEGKKIAKTFWGIAWCDNLESYSDYANRMPRGRTYIRNGSVVHLEIDKGVVRSYVAGSDTYKIEVKIEPLKPAAWKRLKQKCAGEIASVVELLQGKLSKNVLAIVTDKKEGLFPSPKEITLDCSCPDWAVMCKHVAATLYGVGALLDKSPELFFKLRGVDHLALIETSVAIPAGKADSETLDTESLEGIFGVELATSLEDKPAPAKKTSKKAVKKTAKKSTKKAVKKQAPKKTTGKVAKKSTPASEKALKKPVKKKAAKKATIKQISPKKVAGKKTKKTGKNASGKK
ncbi:MAG: hypothetical protein FWH27_00125 [Planctomycetaceae bacterium]|nr:hypothetical protein [Planctomycetaceae bacterium]